MKKIMFNSRYGLEQAVLEGRKTMTRRVIPQKFAEAIKPNTYSEYETTFSAETQRFSVWERLPHFDGAKRVSRQIDTLLFSQYQIGEEVAVAQCYKDIDYRGIVAYEDASDIQPGMVRPIPAQESAGWTNKMFVKADLMPHRIRITNIKVERMQDISEEDAMREGIFHYEKPPLYHECDRFAPWPPYVKPYKHDNDNLKYRATARYAFAYLIDKVSGSGTWKSNPYVLAYEFELIK